MIFLCFCFLFFFFNATSTTEIYTLSLHDALPIYCRIEIRSDHFGPRSWLSADSPSLDELIRSEAIMPGRDRKSTRLNSSHTVISYAVFCLKKKKKKKETNG